MKDYRGTAVGIVKALNKAYQDGLITGRTGISMLCAVCPELRPGSPVVREVGTVFYLDRRIAVHYIRDDGTLCIADLFTKLYDELCNEIE